MRYSQEAADVIVGAAARARGLGHSFVGSIHLLMALCEASDESGLRLRSAAVTEKFVHDAAAVLCGVGQTQLPLPQGFTREAREILRLAAAEALQSPRRRVPPLRHEQISPSPTRCAAAFPFPRGMHTAP